MENGSFDTSVDETIEQDGAQWKQQLQHHPAPETNGGGGVVDSYLDVLKDKKIELQRLLVEIQRLERSPVVKGVSPQSAKRGSPQRAEDEIFKRLMGLEKELKTRDVQLERFMYEKKALSEIVRQQEDGLLQMTGELHDSKQQIMRLGREVKLKHEESKMLHSESKSNFTTSLNNMKLIQSLEAEQKAKGRDNVSNELYYHVLRLENESKDSQRVISELSEENKTLGKLLKQTEEDYLRLHNEYTEKKSADVAHEQQLVVQQNRIIELSHNIAELHQENASLLTLQNAKTDAIEQLTDELNARGATEEYVEQLKREIQQRDMDLSHAHEDSRQLVRIAREKEEVIEELKREEVGIPFQLWHEERRLLQTEVKTLQETKIAFEKKIQQQKEKLLHMNERLNFISKHVGSPKPRNSPAASKRRSGTSSPLVSPDGREIAPPTFEEEEMVPARVVDALEKAVKKLTHSLTAKENAVAEKDEVKEILERKLDVETKAHSADTKLWKKKEMELKEQVAALTERMQHMEEDYREREQELRMEIHKLRAALTKKGTM